jgi:hypothetical protein
LRVFKLLENKVFQPPFLFALLDDSTITVRFGSDKGGKKMVFKLCIAFINAPKPNSSAALDLLATMDAFDKYNNLSDALFKHHIDESQMIFNYKRDPILVIIRNKDGRPLLVQVSVFDLLRIHYCLIP